MPQNSIFSKNSRKHPILSAIERKKLKNETFLAEMLKSERCKVSTSCRSRQELSIESLFRTRSFFQRVFTCARQYNRERASQSSQVIQLIESFNHYSFASSCIPQANRLGSPSGFCSTRRRRCPRSSHSLQHLQRISSRPR